MESKLSRLKAAIRYFFKKRNLLIKKHPNNEFDYYYRKHGDVGLDLYVFSPKSDIIIKPGQLVDVPHGIKVKIPDNCWGYIFHRSSTIKNCMEVKASPIDPGYTGEVFSFLFNFGTKPVVVKNGDRLSQLVIIPKYKYQGNIAYTNYLPSTERGETGFGSTNY